MMKFSYQFDEKSPLIEVSISPQSDLVQVLEAFEDFLKGVGYPVEGHIDIIGEDDAH